MASGTWGDPNVYTKAETDNAIAQSAAITTVTLGTTAYTAQVVYYNRQAIKQIGRVTIQLSCQFNVNIPSQMDIATVPAGYRPSANVYVPAIIITESNEVLPSSVMIASNGSISQGITNYCRGVYVCADYTL